MREDFAQCRGRVVEVITYLSPEFAAHDGGIEMQALAVVNGAETVPLTMKIPHDSWYEVQLEDVCCHQPVLISATEASGFAVLMNPPPIATPFTSWAWIVLMNT
jgi:hypothetical protein